MKTKINKSNYLSFILFLFLIIGVTSCHQDKDLDIHVSSNNNIVVVDGILKFPTKELFDKTLSELYQIQLNQDALENWEKQYIGFTSMKKAYESISEEDIIKISETGSTKGYEGFLSIVGEDDKKQAVCNIDNIMGHLFNKDGFVIVGDYALKATYYKMIKLNNFDASKSKLSDQSFADSNNVEISNIRKTSIQSSTKFNKHEGLGIKNNTALADYYDTEAIELTSLTEYWHGNWSCCKKRVVGELYIWWVDNTNAGGSSGYTFIQGTTKHQKRTSGVWWDTNTGSLIIQFKGHLTILGNSPYPSDQPINLTVERLNSGHFTHTIQYEETNGNGLHYFSIDGDFITNHVAICNDGQTRSCSNKFTSPY
jgi:hypothetical protein